MEEVVEYLLLCEIGYSLDDYPTHWKIIIMNKQKGKIIIMNKQKHIVHIFINVEITLSLLGWRWDSSLYYSINIFWKFSSCIEIFILFIFLHSDVVFSFSISKVNILLFHISKKSPNDLCCDQLNLHVYI